MSWLLVTWFLAFGYVPMQSEYIGASSYKLANNKIATVAQIGLDFQAFEYFHVFTDIETFQYFSSDNATKGGAFSPYRSDYTFGLSFNFNDNAKIVVTHECDHVVSGRKYDGYESGETKIMFKLSGISEFK